MCKTRHENKFVVAFRNSTKHLALVASPRLPVSDRIRVFVIVFETNVQFNPEFVNSGVWVFVGILICMNCF